MENLITLYGHWILFPIVLLEGPITILAISLFSVQLNYSFEFLLLLSIFGDLGGDMLHYLVGRYSRVYTDKFSTSQNKYSKQLSDYYNKKSLRDSIIFIKYFPPITSFGLLYLGHQKANFLKFLIIDSIIVSINSLIIVSLGYRVSTSFLHSDNLNYYISGVMIVFVGIYFGIQKISTLLAKKQEKNADQ